MSALPSSVQGKQAKTLTANLSAPGQLELILSRRHRSIYDYLMEVYSLKGEWQDALEMLQQMYVFFPEDSDLWTYLGLSHYRAGNVDAAGKAFETSFRNASFDEYLPEKTISSSMSSRRCAKFSKVSMA